MDLTEGYAKTQRPPAYAQLLVSSTDRYRTFGERLTAPTTSARWQLSKQYNVLNGYFTRLAITQIQFQWNIPTILTGYNDQFTLVLDDGVNPPVNTGVIEMPSGFYNLNELAVEMYNQIITSPGGVGAQFIAAGLAVFVQDNSLRFTVTAPNTIYFADPGPYDGNPRAYKFYYTAGINSLMIDDVNASSSLDGSPAPMLATRWVDICSSLMTKFQKVKDTTTLPQDKTSDVIARVYAMAPNVSSYTTTAPRASSTTTYTGTVPPGYTGETSVTNYDISQPFAAPWMMTIDYNNPKYIKWSSDEPLGNFDIQVRDEYGDLMPWDTQYPTEYQLTILASES